MAKQNTGTELSADGLRYRSKQPRASVGPNAQMKRACCKCAKPFLVGEGVHRMVMGKPWFFCNDSCMEAMFPKRQVA